MINSLERVSRVENQPPTSIENPWTQRASAVEGSLSSAGKPIEFKKRILVFKEQFLSILKTVFNWIKYQLLFFIYDEEEEKITKVKDAIMHHIEYFFELAEIGTDDECKLIQGAFKALSKDLQKKIKENLQSVIEEILPSESTEKQEEKLKQTLANPFLKINGQLVMVLALFRTKNQSKGP